MILLNPHEIKYAVCIYQNHPHVNKMEDLTVNSQGFDEYWFAVYRNQSPAFNARALFLETSAT